MPTKPKSPLSPQRLRHLAELKSASRQADQPLPRPLIENQKLLHELEVHQIELETQNAELRLARDEADLVREKYTDLYDFAPTGFFTLLADSSIQMVNLAGAALVGIERSRLAGRSFTLLICPSARAAFSTFLRHLFAHSGATRFDSELQHKGHPCRFVTIHAKLSANGAECSLSVTDISDRKRDEDALRQSEIRFRRLFEAAHDGVLLMDPVSRQITDANPFMSELLGYSHAELVGRELYEIGLLEDEATSQKMFLTLKRTHEVRYENLPLKSEAGQHQEVEVVANLYEENGKSVIQCNIRDITVRKLAEDTLRRNEALFTALIEQVPVGVYVIDAEFRLRQANAPAMRSFGAIDDPVGKDFAEIVRYLWPKHVADPTLARFRHTLHTGEPYRSPDFAHRRHDLGVKQVYEWQIERVTLPGGELAVVCFFNDITARIQAERAERKIEVITASNLKLKKEIVRRQAVEEVLRCSRAEESRLLKQSRKHELRLRALSHQILHIQEAERKRISRELHDIIAQTLVGINVHVAALAHDPGAQSASLHERIANTHRLVERSVGIVHQFAQQLRPTSLDDLGLIPALETSLKIFTEETGIRVSLQTFAEIEKIPEIIRTAFYRIAQEALANVAKYSKASAVEIRIENPVGAISLEISDNGQGFDTLKTLSKAKQKRLGLIGMRERAEMIGGELSISSAAAAPTVIRVVVKSPATKKKANSPPVAARV